MSRPVIVVDGAGVIGLATALRLAQAGAEVVLHDPGESDDSASGVAAGMLRQALRPGVAPNWSEPFASTAYLFGLGAPLAFAVAVGSAPAALGRMLGEAETAARPAANLLAAGCALLVSGAALVLWRLRPVIVEWVRRWLVIPDFLRWPSVYAGVWHGYRSTGRTLRVAAAVLEGDGGVLWMLVGALLAGLLVEL